VGSSYVLHVMVEAEDMGKVEAEAKKRLVETEIATKAERGDFGSCLTIRRPFVWSP
jgi:hypothetical protein